MGQRSSTVFIGPVEVAGFCATLADGFHEIGWTAHLIDIGANRFAYGSENSTRFLRSAQRAFGVLSDIERRLGRIGRFVLYPPRALLAGTVFVWALVLCNNFLYVFGQSLLPWNIDLWLLRKLRRPVLHVYLGSDSRPPYLSGKWLADNDGRSVASLADLAARRSRRLRARLSRIYRWSNYVIDNPMSGLLQPGPYINWFALGFPTTIAASSTPRDPRSAETVVVHAPSDSRIKGSQVIERVIEELQSEGLAVRYIALRGVPNAQVKEILDDADIVVDELYSDSPLAGLGSEAAARGCAVIVGGYGWKELESMVATEMLPDSVRITEETLKEQLRMLLLSADRRRKIGARLRHFIGAQWAAGRVASRYAALFGGQPAESWWIDNSRLAYVGGMGAKPAAFRTLIDAIVARHGFEALGVAPDSNLGRLISETYLTAGAR